MHMLWHEFIRKAYQNITVVTDVFFQGEIIKKSFLLIDIVAIYYVV